MCIISRSPPPSDSSRALSAQLNVFFGDDIDNTHDIDNDTNDSNKSVKEENSSSSSSKSNNEKNNSDGVNMNKGILGVAVDLYGKAAGIYIICMYIHMNVYVYIYIYVCILEVYIYT
jgi:hypothetical protein